MTPVAKTEFCTVCGHTAGTQPHASLVAGPRRKRCRNRHQAETMTETTEERWELPPAGVIRRRR
jgi:hypothetical protein